MQQRALSAFIWSVADLLRGDYKPADYGSVILPFTVLRRLDCVLEPTKAEVLAEFEKRSKEGLNPEPFLKRKAGQSFFNTSPMDLKKLLGDPDNIAANLLSYIQGFSAEVRDIFEKFEFHNQIDKLARAKLLFLVTEKFAGIDLHPHKVSNTQMGLVFEELIRKFAEASNETAGDHFTPREVIRLMVNLLFVEDDDVLAKPGVVRTIYDPTAGTGGMLSVAEEHLSDLNPGARLTMSGQELNPESYAICKADMLIKGQDVSNIAFGNTLSEDGHPGKTFDYMLANPPFGVEWKKVEKEVRKEHERQGFDGRFGPGLPRVSDGSLLFLMHMLSKMRPEKEGGCRFGIVLNGSPLFTGGAGSGESEIRRYLLENDLVEAIIALPTDMFFNTGIATYVWIVSNRKPANRKGQVQLIDGAGFWRKMRKSLGSKRKELGEEHIRQITQLFGRSEPAEIATLVDAAGKEIGREIVWAGDKSPPETPEGGKVKLAPLSRLFPNSAFGYRTITVERPLRDVDGEPILGERGKNKGKPLADGSLRDTENVPLNEDIHDYFEREVLPHAPDAWIDESKTKVGYEIPFSRHFYVFEPPRPLQQIDADLDQVTDRIKAMLEEERQAIVAQASSDEPDQAAITEDQIAGWLGALPAHWGTGALKHLINPKRRITYGIVQAGPDIPGGVPYIRPADMSDENGVLDEANLLRTTLEIAAAYQRSALQQGDLVCSIGPSFGKVMEVPPSLNGANLTQGTARVAVKNGVASRFVFWVLRCINSVAQWEAGIGGATFRALNLEPLANTKVTIPPLEDQAAIANFLDKETAKLDALMAEANRTIMLLQERRAALISAAVTGKIDVVGALAVPREAEAA